MNITLANRTFYFLSLIHACYSNTEVFPWKFSHIFTENLITVIFSVFSLLWFPYSPKIRKLFLRQCGTTKSSKIQKHKSKDIDYPVGKFRDMFIFNRKEYWIQIKLKLSTCVCDYKDIWLLQDHTFNRHIKIFE